MAAFYILGYSALIHGASDFVYGPPNDLLCSLAMLWFAVLFFNLRFTALGNVDLIALLLLVAAGEKIFEVIILTLWIPTSVSSNSSYGIL